MASILTNLTLIASGCRLGPEASIVIPPFPATISQRLHRMVEKCTSPDVDLRCRLSSALQILRQALEDGGGLSRECVVCMDAPREARLPCMHKVMCAKCAKLIPDCPVCRKPFQTFQQDDANTTFV